VERFSTKQPTDEAAEEWRARRIKYLRSRPSNVNWSELKRLENASIGETVELWKDWAKDAQRARETDWLGIMGTRERYLDCTLENFQTDLPWRAEVLQAVRTIERNLEEHLRAGRNLVFAGPCGTGKDHLLAALLRVVVLELLQRPKVVFTRGVDACDSAKARGKNRTVELPTVGKGGGAQVLLAISDPVISGCPLRHYEAKRLFQLVDQQYSRRQPIWTTINAQNRAEADELLTAPVSDRLFANALTVFFDGDTYRQPLDMLSA
jgi:DNA replication protein DnaC